MTKSKKNSTGYETKLQGHNLRYYSSICLEGLRKTFKTFSQDKECPDI
jgi:hypothetical protein